MQGTMIYGPRDIRFEDRPEPTIIQLTDAIIRLSATCICGSDLWPYRGIAKVAEPTPMGHEYCGIVEEAGREVRNIKRGQFVVGSFATSDNTCVICKDGYQSSCVQREFMSGAQASLLRVPLADGTLVATSDLPPKELIPSLLATSDVLGTGWFAADAANVKPGSTVVVVGDGAVGLLAVLSAKQMGADRIIAMSRHQSRQKLAREFGATDIVTDRGDEGVACIKELTDGIGADAVIGAGGNKMNAVLLVIADQARHGLILSPAPQTRQAAPRLRHPPLRLVFPDIVRRRHSRESGNPPQSRALSAGWRIRRGFCYVCDPRL